jgi:tetratricopeptide (TPR) repeat protein
MALKSRLLQQLDKAIATAPAQTLVVCLRAQRAVLLARHGQMNEAREELTALHKLSFQHPNPQLGAWLHFAEGLMGYFTDFGSGAAEKVARAQAMAHAVGLAELEALAAAWQAHLAYVRHDIDKLVLHAQACLKLAGPAHHGAHSRLAIALGLAHHFADRPEPAQAWYGQARKHAMAEGDDATQSALMYNMAEMRSAHARRISLAHPARPVPELLLGADSVKHYDAAVGGSAMAELTPVLRAQILVVQGDYAQAQALYEQHLPQAMSHVARLGSSLLADLAWCRVNVGQREQALQQAREAEFELDPACDVDDRAATHSRLAQVYQALEALA